MSNLFYRAFEDLHRGSRDVIKARLCAYIPFLLPLRDAIAQPAALDLGCGRGEWLELLTEHGFDAWGVDLDEGMLAACRERGLKVQTQDALGSLRAQADASLAIISAFHLVEHIPFDDVQELIAQALRALQPGGLLIMETPNPENLVVATSGFYMDPSHLRPIPPMLLEFVVGFAGFPRHKVLRLQEPAALHGPVTLEPVNILNGVSPDFSVLAQKAAPPEMLAGFNAAFATPYGIELAELSHRYQQQQHDARAAIQADVTRLDTRVAAVEQETVSLFDRALTVVGQANEAMHAVQMDLATSMQRERNISDRARELEQQVHVLTGEAIERTRHLQDLQGIQAAFEEKASRAEERIEQADQRARLAEQQVEERIMVVEQRANEHIGNVEDATRLVQQAEHMQWQLNVAMARVAAAEHTLALLHVSRFWRMTAPVRLASQVARRLVRSLRMGGLRGRVQRTLRRTASWLVRKMMGHGRLSRFGMQFLASRPGLKARLRRLIGAQHTPAGVSFPVPVAPGSDGGATGVTPRAARLLAELQKAAAEKGN
jgi:SAM-dependent methyltransferase